MGSRRRSSTCGEEAMRVLYHSFVRPKKAFTYCSGLLCVLPERVLRHPALHPVEHTGLVGLLGNLWRGGCGSRCGRSPLAENWATALSVNDWSGLRRSRQRRGHDGRFGRGIGSDARRGKRHVVLQKPAPVAIQKTLAVRRLSAGELNVGSGDILEKLGPLVLLKPQIVDP